MTYSARLYHCGERRDEAISFRIAGYQYLRSISVSLATRSSVGGCVLKSLAMLLPVSGWTMNRLL